MLSAMNVHDLSLLCDRLEEFYFRCCKLSASSPDLNLTKRVNKRGSCQQVDLELFVKTKQKKVLIGNQVFYRGAVTKRNTNKQL